MKVCSLTWPFPFGVRLGWASAGIPNPSLREAKGYVYLLRGNGIIFSRGFGVLCRELRKRDIWAEDLRCVGDLWMLRHLRANHRAGRLRGPVVMVGHSCGGRYALFAARKLEEVGITVRLLICLDVAGPPPVPANVERAMNLYMTGIRIYPARPLRLAPGSVARIQNIDLHGAESPVQTSWLCHLNLTENKAVQDFILRQVLGAVGYQCSNGPWGTAIDTEPGCHSSWER